MFFLCIAFIFPTFKKWNEKNSRWSNAMPITLYRVVDVTVIIPTGQLCFSIYLLVVCCSLLTGN
jgi:hypothetical protein